jgi:hypothetical protein
VAADPTDLFSLAGPEKDPHENGSGPEG